MLVFVRKVIISSFFYSFFFSFCVWVDFLVFFFFG